MRTAQLLLMATRPVIDWNFLNGVLPGELTATGGENATVIRGGAMVAATAPRFNYDIVSWACKGLLIEEARQNKLLNSLLDGTNLSTQTVTVTNVAHTLSFYGTGTVTLSGTSTAGPLVGSGATTLSTLTFTPTAGGLTLTVSGQVKWAQLEVGSNATSFVPTAGSVVARSADSIVDTAISRWFNPDQGTFVVEFDRMANVASGRVFTLSDGTANENIRLNGSVAANVRPDWQVVDGGVVQANITDATQIAVNAIGRCAMSYRANEFAIASAGILATRDTAGTLPTVDRLALGMNESATGHLNGCLRRLRYYRKAFPDSTLQRLTAS